MAEKESKKINFNRENIESVDRFISDCSEGGTSNLQKKYTMIQSSKKSSVEITAESRKKCVNILIR